MNQQSTTATLINTPLDLYQHLSAFPPDTKWRMTCRGCNQSTFEAVNETIYLKLAKHSLLYSVINTRRRSSIKALLSVLEQQQIPAIIKWKQQRVWEQVGRSNIIKLYDLLSKIDEIYNQYWIYLAMKFFVRDKVIIGLKVRMKSHLGPVNLEFNLLENNNILIFLKQNSLRFCSDKTANRNKYSYMSISFLQTELERVFGSRRLLMLHALAENIAD